NQRPINADGAVPEVVRGIHRIGHRAQVGRVRAELQAGAGFRIGAIAIPDEHSEPRGYRTAQRCRETTYRDVRRRTRCRRILPTVEHRQIAQRQSRHGVDHHQAPSGPGIYPEGEGLDVTDVVVATAGRTYDVGHVGERL